MHADHILTQQDEEDERVYWECSCGRSGSAPTWKVDLAMEKHVPAGESVVYRSRVDTCRMLW